MKLSFHFVCTPQGAVKGDNLLHFIEILVVHRQSSSKIITSWIFTTLTFWTLGEWNMSENLSVSLEAITDHSKKIVKYKRLSFVQSNLLSLMKSVFPLQVYKVVVNFGEESWFIFRRYNEFHSLHEKVSKSSIHITCYNLCFSTWRVKNNMFKLFKELFITDVFWIS